MAENLRLDGERNRAALRVEVVIAMPLEQVQVRAADAHRADADQHVARTDFGVGNAPHGHLRDFFKDGSFHKEVLSCQLCQLSVFSQNSRKSKVEKLKARG